MSASISCVQKKRVPLSLMALLISLCAQSLLCKPANSLPFLTAKNGNLHTPLEEKLNSNTVEETSGDDKHYVKLHVDTLSIAPKGPIDGDGSSNGHITLPSKSLKNEIENSKGSALDRARQVNVMPLLLMETYAEAEGKEHVDREFERAHLSDLWESTLNRNQDVQFVVQKLMPSSDRNHTTTILMRMISSVVASGVNSTNIIFGTGPATVIGSQITSNMIYQLLNAQDAKANKNAQIDQTQVMMLYHMVRNTADRVTESYRDYKVNVRRIDTAHTRSLKLQSLVQEGRAGQDAAKQIEMEYWLDRAKSDVDEAVYTARRYRQTLIDLAGHEAVDKVDKSFQDQFLAEKENK
jgi:hypothetical protein